MSRKLPQDVRVQQILEAARSCFLQTGYYQTRVDDIAVRAGLSKGGVYFHFRSKRDIFLALVEADYEQSMGALREIVASPEDIPRKLRALARHYFQLFATNTDHARFMVVLGDMALRDLEMRSRLHELHRNYINELAGLLRQGLTEGQLREELDLVASAELLKHTIDGVEMAFALGIPVRIDRLLRTGLEVVLHGVQRIEASPPAPRA